MVQLLLQTAHLLEQFIGVGPGQLRGDLVVPLDQGLGPGHALFHVAEHGFAFIQCRFLRQDPDAVTGHENNLAVGRLSRPAMTRSSVDLPIPFGPTTPILAPGKNASVTSSRTTLPS